MGNENAQSTKVITGKVRFSYVNIFKSRSFQTGQDEKFSICLLIPKKDKETKDDTPQQPTGGETSGNGQADGKTSGLTQTSDSAGAAMTLAAGVAATAAVTAASAKLASRRRKESGR